MTEALVIRQEDGSGQAYYPGERRKAVVIFSLADSRSATTTSTRLDRANLTGLVLGCIEAKFCKKICV